MTLSNHQEKSETDLLEGGENEEGKIAKRSSSGLLMEQDQEESAKRIGIEEQIEQEREAEKNQALSERGASNKQSPGAIPRRPQNIGAEAGYSAMPWVKNRVEVGEKVVVGEGAKAVAVERLGEVKKVEVEASVKKAEKIEIAGWEERNAGGIETPDQPTEIMEAQKVQVAEGSIENVILYRSLNFYVKTTIRPNKRPAADPLRKPTGHTTMMPKIMPAQKVRVAESETRLMPAIDVKELAPRKRIYLPSWTEFVVVALGVFFSIIAHAYNMFNYPRYEMDEGTYMSSAWSILNGKITPDPYGYGHPPFDWMQLAGLVQMVGGFFLFGNAINTGRVLMLLYTFGSTLLVYLIMRKISGSRSAALLTLVLFAFSPLAINYQRLVMLDNIATFWFLLSLYFLVISKSRLTFMVLSAICFGLAMLSKEVLLLFMPGMIYAVWLHTSKFQRKFALVAFIYAFASIGSLFILMAILKGELFPDTWTWIPGNSSQHLSLLGTLLFQTKRGSSEGGFNAAWVAWNSIDPVFIYVGIVSIVFNLIAGWWRRNQLLIAVLAASYWLLLIRGGVVFPFYFIPLIPMVAMCITFMINTIADWIGRFVRLDLFRAFLLFCAIAGFMIFDATASNAIYNTNVTKVQTEAMAWAGENVSRNSYIVISNYLYLDMHEQGGASVGNGAVFPNANIFVNIATDPVLLSQLQGKWDRIDYIIADSQIETYLTSDSLLPKNAKFMRTALYAAGYPDIGKACAVFKASNYEIHVWCVKHQTPRPVVLAPPGAQQLLAGESTPVDKRAQLG